MTDYRLAKAIIEDSRYYDTGTKTDHNTFACRIIPDMQDIQEAALLPRYPNFLSDQQKAYSVGDVVWVLCVQDFHVGYVLGLAEPATGSSDVVNALTLILDAERKIGLETLSSYNSLQFSVKNTGAIDFSDSALQISGTIYANNLVVLYDQKGGMYVRNDNMRIKFTDKGEMIVEGQLGEIDVKESHINSSKAEDIHDSYKMETRGPATFEVGGAYQVTASGSSSDTTLGSRTELTTLSKTETIGLGELKTIVAGGSATTVMAGAYALTVGAGALSLTTGIGVVTITAGGGILITAPLVTITAGALIVTAPFLRFPVGATFPLAGGPGPFCGLPFCVLTGIPHTASWFFGI